VPPGREQQRLVLPAPRRRLAQPFQLLADGGGIQRQRGRGDQLQAQQEAWQPAIDGTSAETGSGHCRARGRPCFAQAVSRAKPD